MPNTRPRYLFAVASSSQLYSGTGTAIFDWIRYSRDYFDFSFLMDNLNLVNFKVAEAFCSKENIPFHVSAPLLLPGCPDSGLAGIAGYFRKHACDLVECVSWANASTNMSLIGAKPASTKLLFTPHSQPLDTLPNHDRYFMVLPAFSKTLQSSDAIFIDSVEEKNHPAFQGTAAEKIHSVPLGVDTSQFTPSGPRTPWQLACVCDCREPRKRIDLLLAAFALAHSREPRLRLVLAGMNSDKVVIPESLDSAVTRLGYITRAELVRTYQSVSAFVLISDYEAFGLPIAEALCCGTRVLLHHQPVLTELFSGLPGVHWTTNTDTLITATSLIALGSAGVESAKIADASRRRFALETTYGRKRETVRELLERTKGAH